MKQFIIWVSILFLGGNVIAQRIIYSEPDKDDIRDFKFEIIGKINNKFLVYKTAGYNHFISVYNDDMVQVDKLKLDYLTERVFNVDFINYPDFAYMFYQYQKRGIIYCMAVKIDGDGKKVGEPMELDTTNSREVQNNKIYSFVQSTDKSKIMFFKINTTQDKYHQITTILFDNKLNKLNKASENVPMRERNSFLTSFEVSNNGNFAFIKAIGTSSNDNINQLVLITKEAFALNFNYINIVKKESVYLDEVKLKSDNTNNRYIITSFYSNKKRGDILGLYVTIYDNISNSEKLNTVVNFDNEFRTDAKSDGNIKTAFNDFFIKEIIVKKDGGFLLNAENEYTSTRNNTNGFNRWDNLDNMNGYYGTGGFYNFGSPFYYSPYNLYRNRSFYNVTRYFTDNIAIVSFDSLAKLQWTNVIRKSQFDDKSDALISYGTFNAGNQIKYLFNVLEKNKWILNEQSLTPNGQIIRSSTLKNLDKGYEFMPRHAKQVGAYQFIIPCMYRSYLCFAKIDY
jgi:hypothetical protein